MINHLSFRNKNNSVFWRKDNYIIILYGEYLSEKINANNESFSLFWNFEKLKPIIKSFVEYANNYISGQCVVGKIEFVNIGDKVNITYFD